ncbi:MULTISPECIES: HalOD1 output domain-containing protein [Haloferacaceae]|uniref:HalOD1 output domain-containing protein n=1 Tax=Halorubrum glutamatedens TaxID=2707018 RepID=A0ABD5QVS9_9EURY|nr:HalOD1 output domain-containing protein [Halobellus captivus]
MSSDTAGAFDGRSTLETVRVDHSRGVRSPSLAVVEAISGLAGTDAEFLAEEAGIVLYDHVDPDAIDAFVAHRSDAEFDLSFTVGRYAVRVDGEEAVARIAE